MWKIIQCRNKIVFNKFRIQKFPTSKITNNECRRNDYEGVENRSGKKASGKPKCQ